jgi:hypothetical protein
MTMGPGSLAGSGGKMGSGGGGGSGTYASKDADTESAAVQQQPQFDNNGNPIRKVIKPRYEFVVVFVWKEPTPSDKLITPASDITESVPAAPAGGPGPGRGGK